MINAGRKDLAAEISPGQVIGGRRSQAGKGAVGDGEVGMSLCRRSVSRVESAVDDDAWRESRDGGARTDSDIAGNGTGAGIGHGRRAQNGEVLGLSEGLRLSLSCESRPCGEGEEKSRNV